MADVVFVAVAVAFFVLCLLYVCGLDRLVRSAEKADGADLTAEDVEVAA